MPTCGRTAYWRVLSDIRMTDAGEARRIEECLRQWAHRGGSSGRKIVQNLQCDRTVTDEVMRALLEEVGRIAADCSGAHWMDCWKRLVSAYEKTCRTLSYQGEYCGGSIGLEEMVGWRAVSKARLRDAHLRANTFGNEKELDEFLDLVEAAGKADDSHRRETLRKLKEKYGNYAWSPHTMWSTWSEGSPDSPFRDEASGATWGADQIRAALGLSYEEREKPLLVLAYVVSANTLKVPTVADAGTFSYFRVSSFGPCGRTDPWHPAKNLVQNAKGDAFDPDPLPEAVHSPVQIGDTHRIEYRL